MEETGNNACYTYESHGGTARWPPLWRVTRASQMQLRQRHVATRVWKVLAILTKRIARALKCLESRTNREARNASRVPAIVHACKILIYITAGIRNTGGDEVITLLETKEDLRWRWPRVSSPSFVRELDRLRTNFVRIFLFIF